MLDAVALDDERAVGAERHDDRAGAGQSAGRVRGIARAGQEPELSAVRHEDVDARQDIGVELAARARG